MVVKLNNIQEGIIQVIGDYLYPIFALKAISDKSSECIKITNLYSNFYSDNVINDLFASLLRICPNKSITFESPTGYYSKNFEEWIITRTGLSYFDAIPYTSQSDIIKYFSKIINTRFELEFGYMMNKYFSKSSYNVECIPLANFRQSYVINYVLLIAYNKYNFHFIFSTNNKNIVPDSFVFDDSDLVPINFRLKEKLANNYYKIPFGNISIKLERRNEQIMIQFIGNDTVNNITYVIFKILVSAKSLEVSKQIENLLIYVNKIKSFKEIKCVVQNKDLAQQLFARSLVLNEEFGSW